MLAYVANGEVATGDSGGPVWDPDTHRAVGVIIGSSPDFAHCEHTFVGDMRCDMMAFAPLRNLPDTTLGAATKLGVEILVKGG